MEDSYEDFLKDVFARLFSLDYLAAITELESNDRLKVVDKFLIFVILIFYRKSQYWNYIQESCEYNFPYLNPRYDHQYGYIILHYFKKSDFKKVTVVIEEITQTLIDCEDAESLIKLVKFGSDFR